MPQLKNPLTTALDVVTAKSINSEGWYHVESCDGCTFEFYSHGRGRFQRERIRGELELNVMNELNTQVSEGMHVRDVGTAWGYFTLAIASMGASITAFEIDPNRYELISEEARRNNWENRVSVINGAVGDYVVLDEYPTPNVVKIDIEGWEYEALKGATETLSAGPTWIVEIHEPELNSNTTFAKPGEQVVSLFRENGYETTYLEERSKNNYYIVANK